MGKKVDRKDVEYEAQFCVSNLSKKQVALLTEIICMVISAMGGYMGGGFSKVTKKRAAEMEKEIK